MGKCVFYEPNSYIHIRKLLSLTICNICPVYQMCLYIPAIEFETEGLATYSEGYSTCIYHKIYFNLMIILVY